jgi:hypothetical protein
MGLPRWKRRQQRAVEQQRQLAEAQHQKRMQLETAPGVKSFVVDSYGRGIVTMWDGTVEVHEPEEMSFERI